MNDRSKLLGWSYVAVQAVLFCALLFLPGRDDWPTPGWLNGFGMALVVAGLVVCGVAVLRLGTAFTPTPVPSERGQLTTTGLYRHARHPIYTGVLVIVVGLMIRSGSWITAAVGLVTIAFFNVKARWEEERLREHYSGYDEYSAVVPRFVPRPWRNRNAG